MGPAAFAALTAILAKVGMGGAAPDTATLIRTCVILCLVAGNAAAGRQCPSMRELPGEVWLF